MLEIRSQFRAFERELDRDSDDALATNGRFPMGFRSNPTYEMTMVCVRSSGRRSRPGDRSYNS